ncbi:MAG: L,D-transpeptidase family protein [Deltaproteobacteria bacterium]|nr:L,D-transpeptidase family protein [Deltaproteobacteria bacterium]
MRRIRHVTFLFYFFASCPLWAAQFDPPSNIQRLNKAVQVYEGLSKKGPWPEIPKGEKIEPLAEDERIPLIRKRLEAEGYIKKSSDEKIYDDKLLEVVKLYQIRNGMEPDGVIGKGTVATMNVPVEKRVCQLKINRLRFTSLAATTQAGAEGTASSAVPTRYIRVNVPDFHLHVVKDDEPVLASRVIAGRRDRKTPIFNDEITHLVVNPAWYVPRSIAVKDKLPTLQKDPDYLERMGMRLYGKSPEGETIEVDPGTVDWTTVTPNDFDYRIVQKPGAGNALGTVKFLFPNKYDVYLHDTSDRHLFRRDSRSFSSGCVRVENYMELAEYVLKDTPDWDREKIESAIDSGIQRRIDLTVPFPIHIVYVTAWVDEDGTVQFRNDVYGYDSPLAKTACSELP